MQLNDTVTQLQHFIQHHRLMRDDGVIAFDAQVTLTRNDTADSFPSEIQVISLPKEKVLYVLAPAVQHIVCEMYRSGSCTFHFQEDSTLLIKQTDTSQQLIIAPLSPVL